MTQAAVLAQMGNTNQTFRNRIINGAMVIDQRNAGASVSIATTSDVYTLDRWAAAGQSADGVFTVQQDTTIPAGFKNSMKVTVTTADSSIGASQYYLMQQNIEGLNLTDINWGTVNAQNLTLSVWVRSSVTGTFGGSLRGSFTTSTRSYPFSYTINSANTWEQKSITITGDQSGTWATDNSTGIRLTFSLGDGSSRLGTANTWATANYTGVTGQTNLIATNAATWYVTGVQLEKGSTATSFDYRPYGTELALCQRYYQKSFPIGTAPAQNTGSYVGSMSYTTSVAGTTGKGVFSYPLFVPMRANATQTFYSPGNASANFFNRATGAISGGVSIPYGDTSTNNINAFNTQVAGDSTGQFIAVHWTCEAEL